MVAVSFLTFFLTAPMTQNNFTNKVTVAHGDTD